MREIKFRGYDPIGQSWCIGYLLKDADIKDRWYIMNNYSDGVIIDSKSIGEFSGRLDIDGKEIFEGDVVRRADGSNYAIAYYKGAFVLEDIKPLYQVNGSLKIIGNVYEQQRSRDTLTNGHR